jgi:glycerol kinase
VGAAFLAGLAVGFWDGTDALEEQWQAERTFEPDMPRDRVEERVAGWRRAVDRARHWAEPTA